MREDKILILNKDTIISEIKYKRKNIKDDELLAKESNSKKSSENNRKNEFSDDDLNNTQVELDDSGVEQQLSVSELGKRTKQASKAQALRTEILKPLIAELKSQASHDSEVKIIDIRGAVKFPGVYPLFEGADIKTLISLAGGLKESSYLQKAEMSRFTEVDGKEQLEYLQIDLEAVLKDKSILLDKNVLSEEEHEEGNDESCPE